MRTNPKQSKKGQDSLLIQDLIQLESYIRAFWEFLPIPVCYVNPAFNILDVDKSFENLSGFTSLEIIGEGLEKIFLQPQEIEEIEKQLLATRTIFNKETTLLTKAKEEISVIFSAMPREDEEGSIVGYFLAFLDITEIKKFEQELKEKIEDLERFQRLVIGRELKMIELKKTLQQAEDEIKKLKGRK